MILSLSLLGHLKHLQKNAHRCIGKMKHPSAHNTVLSQKRGKKKEINELKRTQNAGLILPNKSNTAHSLNIWSQKYKILSRCKVLQIL